MDATPTSNPFFPGTEPAETDKPPCLLKWCAHSKAGTKKPVNDDSWLAFASDIHGANKLENEGKHSLAAHDLIFAVSDGMGGGNAGDVASRILLEELSSIIPKTFKTAAAGLHPDYLSHLEKAINTVHEAINEQATKSEKHQGMAATLALAWFTPENMYLTNVGDSRIYLHRTNKEDEQETQMLTIDHTFAWRKLQRGEINEREFRHHPRRSALYEVVGGGHPTVRPHVAAIPYEIGDRFLICSDGLIDGLWEKHIHSGFCQNADSTRSLAHSLMDRATANDGRDDTTLIAISVHLPDENSSKDT